MTYRSEQLRRRRVFWLAWLLLVVVVAYGFWTQARRIDKNERVADSLCVLLMDLNAKDGDHIVAVFEDLGYDCIP